jgi:hypothetical protein
MEGQGARVFGHSPVEKIRTGLRKCKVPIFHLRGTMRFRMMGKQILSRQEYAT